MAPSTPAEQNVAPVGGAAHVPIVFPCTMVQVPEQQSDPCEHTSLV
jgi:hypothetical protein